MSSFDHYTPLVTVDYAGFWAWAADTFAGQGQEKVMKALKSFGERVADSLRVPEWVEEILLYAVYTLSERFEAVLDLYQLAEEDKEKCRGAFGQPAALAELPMAFIFQDEQCRAVECPETLRNNRVMNDIFEALGFTVSPFPRPLHLALLHCRVLRGP